MAPRDRNDLRTAQAAVGVLAAFNEAGVLDAADVQVAGRLGALAGETDEDVLLAIGVTVRALRHGSVCVRLDSIAMLEPELDWPEPRAWLARVESSPLTVAGGPLRVDQGALYLDRYWRQEIQVCDGLLGRDRLPPSGIDVTQVRESMAQLFLDPDPAQQLAALVTARRPTVVLGGGPGTGKTTLVARLLAMLNAQSGHGLRIALAAPTGKAAAQLAGAVSAVVATLPADARAGLPGLGAMTVHRLLGWLPDSRFRYHRDNRLPYDVVVVDEASMVSLSMMAGLLDSLRPETRLILVGDPDQLASVEAGAVLADIVDGLSARPPDAASAAVDEAGGELVSGVVPGAGRGWPHGIVILQKNWRFSGGIAGLADAIRGGDPDAAWDVLRASGPDVSMTPDGVEQDVLEAALSLREAAEAGDESAALKQLDRHRVLCAHRTGPAGVQGWDRQIIRWLAPQNASSTGDWYVGRPLLITANDYALGLNNGDTGVVMRDPDGSMMAVFRRGDSTVRLRPSRLADVLTVHAMTVHRSQGSQFDRVTLVLPPVDSPWLTRETFYTAVTRARQHIRVLGSKEQVRWAVTHRAVRATGLSARLRDG